MKPFVRLQAFAEEPTYAKTIPASVAQPSTQEVFMIWRVENAHHVISTTLNSMTSSKRLISQLANGWLAYQDWMGNDRTEQPLYFVQAANHLPVTWHSPTLSPPLTSSSPRLPLEPLVQPLTRLPSTNQQSTTILLLRTVRSHCRRNNQSFVSTICGIHLEAWQMNHHDHQRNMGDSITEIQHCNSAATFTTCEACCLFNLLCLYQYRRLTCYSIKAIVLDRDNKRNNWQGNFFCVLHFTCHSQRTDRN